MGLCISRHADQCRSLKVHISVVQHHLNFRDSVGDLLMVPPVPDALCIWLNAWCMNPGMQLVKHWNPSFYPDNVCGWRIGSCSAGYRQEVMHAVSCSPSISTAETPLLRKWHGDWPHQWDCSISLSCAGVHDVKSTTSHHIVYQLDQWEIPSILAVIPPPRCWS